MGAMVCPNCQTPLTEQRVTGGIIHACTTCDGIAITLPFLRKRGIDPYYLNWLWDLANHVGHTGKACPQCTRTMQYVALPVEQQPLLLDVCTKCFLVWFDRQEYDLLSGSRLSNMTPPTTQEVCFDKEVCYDLRVELLKEQITDVRNRDGDKGSASDLYDEVASHHWKILPLLLGQPVEINEPPVSRRPVVTYLLAGFISTVFLATLAGLHSVIPDWGFIPSQMSRNYGLTILTSFFLHNDFFHLLSTLSLLIIFGDNVEDYLGRPGLLIALVCSHLAGLILHSLCFSASVQPYTGAGAGLAGVLAFYAIRYPHTRIELPLSGRKILGPTVNLPAYGAFIFWVSVQVIIFVLQLFGYSYTGGLSHLGGAALGLVTGMILKFKADAH